MANSLLVASAQGGTQRVPVGTIPATTALTANRFQDESVHSVPDVATDEATRSILDRAWESDPILQNKVSISVHQTRIEDFLVTLSTKTGLKFSLGPQSLAASKKLTCIASDLPIFEVMSCLSRLYGIRWDKHEEIYVASDIELNEVERLLLKFGEVEAWQTPESSISSPQRALLAQAILRSTSLETLKSAQGVPLSALPSDLQAKLRQQMEYHAAIRVVNPYAHATIPILAESTVDFKQTIYTSEPNANGTAPKSPSVGSTPPATLSLSNFNGKSISVVATFSPAPISESIMERVKRLKIERGSPTQNTPMRPLR